MNFLPASFALHVDPAEFLKTSQRAERVERDPKLLELSIDLLLRREYRFDLVRLLRMGEPKYLRTAITQRANLSAEILAIKDPRAARRAVF